MLSTVLQVYGENSSYSDAGDMKAGSQGHVRGLLVEDSVVGPRCLIEQGLVTKDEVGPRRGQGATQRQSG